MICPKCKSSNNFVKDTRHHAGETHRRRECIDCGYKFNTIEITATKYKDLKKDQLLQRLAEMEKGGACE